MTQPVLDQTHHLLGATHGPPEINIGWLLLVCLVLLAFAIAAWWRTRLSDRPGRSPIRVLASRMLGGKRWLTLVEVENERLLLSVAGEEIRLIRCFPAGGLRPRAGGPRVQKQPVGEAAKTVLGSLAGSHSGQKKGQDPPLLYHSGQGRR